ncbi:Piso0_001207 [Millerozyma farinosa CBS 7064]|uniref:Piso0_001207 protein n=1 Tax=Pichia sorbitophila (strain ATCC MYA-4447 / BCRC 22081 / CBS 7064 / NBRC 10061 / NRRL Y-12695) TaxID=559304 RepID=G8YMJ8_PICSO|nr:Piso0_001207 [Millerozyma farinosa CBS 7064]
MVCKKFMQVDVFSHQNFKGNPVAVFFDADDMSSYQMQTIARWTNLSETTFVLKPTSASADYRVRIFCPTKELDFAGHPTLGTCHALIESRLISSEKNEIIQECKKGLVKIAVTKPNHVKDWELSFELPGFSIENIDSSLHEGIETSLGITANEREKDPKLLKVGPNWVVLQLKDGDIIKNLDLDPLKLVKLSTEHKWSGLQLFSRSRDGTLEARTFAPASGISEDPACGSGAAAVGAYLSSFGEINLTLNLRQGRNVGRDALLKLRTESDGTDMNIYVGGHCNKCIEGEYHL